MFLFNVENIKPKFHKIHNLLPRMVFHSAFIAITFLITYPQPLMGNISPQFMFEVPEALGPSVARLKEITPQSIQRTMDFLGLNDPGPPIQVILAPNDSPPAQHAPEWMSGYAQGQTSTIVLLTDRVLTYPNNSLKDVFLHEVSHILTHRAAGGQPLPRWFDEGLAMLAARTWDLEDRARLVWAMVSGTQVSLDELNALFRKDETSVRGAYVLAYAFTLDLLEHTNRDVPKRILTKIKQGIPFPEAFAQTTFMTLAQAEENFWSRQTIWTRWLPVATSSGMVWLTITFLAFWVWKKQRKRAAAIKQQWREDDWDL